MEQLQQQQQHNTRRMSEGPRMSLQRRPLHLQEERRLRTVRRRRARPSLLVSGAATALLLTSSWLPLRCEASDMVAGTIATVLQTQGTAAGKPEPRDRFVSAAALLMASSAMFNVAAGDTVSQPLAPMQELTLERKAGDDSDYIGDGVRSEASSSHFFESIDSDGDGTLQAPELANIVRESIAETPFDTVVEDEVSRVMKKLGRTDKEGVESSDIFAYWMQLESLLTVDEVAEWVVHAVQMPESVGKTFRENFVTGYDFPELVENGGEALLSELKIERSSWRKKIIRHVYARLLGIGSVPTPPSDVKHKLESCSTVSFSWKRSTASGFPVHSYRVQRRAVDLHRTESSESLDISMKSAQQDGQMHAKDTEQIIDGECVLDGVQLEQAECAASSESGSDWVTVYSGGELEFVDTSLELGKNYLYRFQAWNSVGRSAPWVTVDISRALKKQKCTSQKAIVTHGGNWTSNETAVLSFLYWSGGTLLSGTYFVAQFVLTVIALASAFMRFKRASAKTTASADYEPVSPSFLSRFNSFFARVLGVEVVPSSELGANSTLRHSKNMHDRSVNAVGLNGYKQDASMPKGDPSGRRLAFQRRKCLSASDIAPADGTPSLRPQKNVSFRVNRVRNAPLGSCHENSVARYEGCFVSSSRDASPYVSRESSVNSLDSESGEEVEDDHNRCNSCRKSYKFGKRWRHHCARCMSTFCHKHGRTTHSNLTACKVPGTCVCNVCLELEQFNQNPPPTRTSPRSNGKRWLGRRSTRSTEGSGESN